MKAQLFLTKKSQKMKSLKISFAAIIAIIALGVTFAAQADFFEAKAARAQDCYISSIADPLAVRTLCGTSEADIVPGVACNLAVIGDHVWDLSSTLVDPTDECPGGTKFCCLQIETDPAPCATSFNQPLFNGAKRSVKAVFCKAN